MNQKVYLNVIFIIILKTIDEFTTWWDIILFFSFGTDVKISIILYLSFPSFKLHHLLFPKLTHRLFPPLQISNFETQIIDLTSQVTELEDKLADIKLENTKLKNDIVDVKTNADIQLCEAQTKLNEVSCPSNFWQTRLLFCCVPWSHAFNFNLQIIAIYFQFINYNFFCIWKKLLI